MSKRMGRERKVVKCRECGRRTRRSLIKQHHYVESGLSNVYLHGVAVYACQAGHEVLELPRVEMLHSLIVQKLLTKPSSLHGEELRFIRKFFGLKAVDLARMLTVTPTTVSRWETGEERIGAQNDKLTRLSLTLKLAEHVKDQAAETYRQMADAYLDLMNEINSMTTRESNNDPVSISSEELQNPPLVFQQTLLPAIALEPSSSR